MSFGLLAARRRDLMLVYISSSMLFAELGNRNLLSFANRNLLSWATVIC
jgi:hypothetical protein